MKLGKLKYALLALVLLTGAAEAQMYMKHPTDVRYIGGNMTNKRPFFKTLDAALNDIKALATSERPYIFWVISDTINVADWDSVYQTDGLAMNDSIDVHYVAVGKIKWGGFAAQGTGGGGGSDIHAPPTNTTTHYSLWTWTGQSGLDSWQTRLASNADSIDERLWELIVYTDSTYLYIDNDTLKMRSSTIQDLIDASGVRPDTTAIAYKAEDETITGDWTNDGDLSIGTGSLRLSSANNNTGISRVVWSASNKPHWSGSGAAGDSSEIVMVNTVTGVLSIDSLITFYNLSEAVRDSMFLGWYHMHFTDSSEVIACSTDTWSTITNENNTLFTEGSMRGNIVMTGDSIHIVTGGTYKIDYMLSFSGANADVWHTGFYLNNVLLKEGHTTRGMSGADAGVISGTFIIEAGPDEWLRLSVMNSANANDITAIDGDISIERLD